MPIQKFQPKQVAPIQYLLKQLNSDAGKVTPGWGTTPFMAILMALFFLFLLMILQIFNASILLEGVKVDWSALSSSFTTLVPAIANNSFGTTATGISLGLAVFAALCIAFISYGARTYPRDQE